MNRKRIIVLLVIVIAGITGAFIFSHFRKANETGFMVLSGNVEVTQPNVGFKIPGRVIELRVDEGDRVRAGDPIGRLDSTELDNVVSQNKAMVKEAETRLEELKAGSRAQEIDQARALVAGREAELIRNKKEYDRAVRLLPQGAISASHFDAARSAYENSVALHKSALEQLSLVKEGPRREDIKMAEHRVEQARAALKVAEERRNDCTLFSPIHGVVLKKNVELGEIVQQGVPVITIGDLDKPWIKVYVKEDKIGLVKLGQKAEVTVDSYRNKVYRGRVTYISSEAEFTPKNVQTAEERVKLVYGVKVRVDNENGELKPSMPADVKLDIRP